MLKKDLVSTTKYPDYPFLDTSRIDAIEFYLASRNFLEPDEHVRRVERGSGRPRNATVRVVTDNRSFMLKCFMDWPANGSAAPAADERFRAECQFHRSARIANCGEEALPVLLHHDCRGRCVVFADAGAPASANDQPGVVQAESLAWFLVNLHHHSQSVPACARYENWNVRQWLGSSLFAGRSSASDPHGRWLARLARKSATVRQALAEARLALAEGSSCLIHGDFLPRNWLRRDGRWRIVDAEFSFFGRPEFDAGSLLAGLLFERVAPAVIAAAVRVFESGCVRYEPRFVAAFAGAQLCALLDGVETSDDGPRGAAASGLLRRVARAIESRSLAPLSRGRRSSDTT